MWSFNSEDVHTMLQTQFGRVVLFSGEHFFQTQRLHNSHIELFEGFKNFRDLEHGLSPLIS